MNEDTAVTPENRLRLGAMDYVWQDGELQDAMGRRVALRAKALKMFAALLSHRGRVLSKDQLSQLVWPDTVATDESIARCIADIRKALNDDAHRIVQTFPKQGYRLNASIRRASKNKDRRDRPRGTTRRLRAVSVLLLIVAGVLAALIGAPGRDRAETNTAMPTSDLRDAVAILPFDPGSDGDRFLASGLSDDLEIRLAEMSAIKMVSRRQVSAIVDVRQGPVALARSLDARYLVDGEFQQSGGAVSFALRLIDGSDGTTLWADRYEGSRAGLMTFRGSLPETLAGAMSIELNARDRRRLAHEDTDDPVAFEEVMQARRELSSFTYEGSLAAERLLRKAIASDPDYARAYAELASVFAIRMENNWTILSIADEDKAFHFAREALRRDADSWFSHYALGRLHSVARSGDTETALLHLRRAMSLHPANDDPRAYFAVVTAMSGNLAEGEAIFESIMATHPEPPFWYYLGLGTIKFHQTHYDKAIDALDACLSQMPNSPYCLRIRIAALARSGRPDDAAWAIEEYAILGHEISLKALMQTSIERDPDLRTHLENSYRLAGIE